MIKQWVFTDGEVENSRAPAGTPVVVALPQKAEPEATTATGAPRFEGRILDVTLDVAITWGAIQGECERRGHLLPVIDALIAATALTHDLTVVTRNKSDMARSGATIFDPWGK